MSLICVYIYKKESKLKREKWEKRKKEKEFYASFQQKKGYWLNLFTQLSHTKKNYLIYKVNSKW